MIKPKQGTYLHKNPEVRHSREGGNPVMQTDSPRFPLAGRIGFCKNQSLRMHTACYAKPLLHPSRE